jgi:arylsulfatase A
LQTFASLAGAEAPKDRLLDGYDLSPALRGEAPSPRQSLLYYAGATLAAVRRGPYKAHFIVPGRDAAVQPQLYNLDVDPSERFDIADASPGIIAELRKLAAAHQKTVVPVKDQIATRVPVTAPCR